ncbi:MAG: DUF3299 domain-containing protein [Hyphomonadaceae bacterium JAD_PAG50586_4]|nr:MAG: DUF3299 domain-containing protein [Hyphomonadaceae bacterium JAD_PAG50586_4]
MIKDMLMLPRKYWAFAIALALLVSGGSAALWARSEAASMRDLPRHQPLLMRTFYEPALSEPADAIDILEIQQSPPVEDIWRPAATPRGGVAWSLLESTQESTRTVDGVIYSRPVFPADVRALAGRRIIVAGYMMPLENGAAQRHFVLMAYPPGCPFHFHALPNQFIEVYADAPVRLNEIDATVISGVLELTGEDESGVFFRLRNARAG